MKKFILLTFMLLSGFSLSAQNAQTYVYDSFVYRTDKSIKVIPYNLQIICNSDESFCTISFSLDNESLIVIHCSHGQHTEEQHVYFATIYGYGASEDNSIIIAARSRLSSFLYNNGLDPNSDHLDESKAIEVYVVYESLNCERFYLYPIKNK